MKAPDFAYLRPSSLDEAITMLAGDDAMPLAGGQSLMPMMNFRVASPEMLVDLAGLQELRGITADSETLVIGAMTTYAELMRDKTIQAKAPLIGMTLPHIAHDAIRSRGTIGGSIALADPAAEMPALMLALGARFAVAGPEGARKINANDFFLGSFETALGSGELLTAIHIPVGGADHAFGFHELTQRHGDYALAGVAVVRTGKTFRAAFFGVADRAVTIHDVNTALGDHGISQAIKHLDQIGFVDDQKASASTRHRLAAVALTRAIEGMHT